MANRPIRLRRSRRRQITVAALAVMMLLLASMVGWLWLIFDLSTPRLAGDMKLAGLTAPVKIARDAAGVPTIDGTDRLDLARALGFLHGQERFFQMDLLRRVGAGELSGLVGSAALPIDRAHRLHRFRARADAIFERMPEPHRALIDAYTAGVNAGLAALGHTPFEYTILRTTPANWRPADTLLVIYAMYFDLQDSDGWTVLRRSLARQRLGDTLAAFLYPSGTPADVALDGSMLPSPAMPTDYAPNAAPINAGTSPPPAHGSNAFAVAGQLTATGAAIVANDMHLGLRVPNTWYRARMRLMRNGRKTVDLDGMTLPGTPMLVTGSNGHIAWGFTDSYIRTGDLVTLEPAPGDTSQYLTPTGPQAPQHLTEQLCPVRGACEDLAVDETIWGPIIGSLPDGRKLVWRWAAHDANAIDLDGMLALESAGAVHEALDAAHRAGMPQQNFVVGDSAGHIGWTIIGQVPLRVGLADDPSSWADGSRGWQGYLPPDQVPEIVDPADGRIWTANNRIVGGNALDRLGDGGYAEADRAHEIKDDLDRTQKFQERDLLAIQLNTKAPVLDGWQQLLLRLLEARQADPKAASLLAPVRDWGGAAHADAVGYRLVRTFEEHAVRLIYGGLCAPVADAAGALAGPVIATQSMWPSLQLLTNRPAGVVPPPYRTWDEVDETLVKGLLQDIDSKAGGDPARFSWGARNRLGIHHPLSTFVPLLGLLTDPNDQPIDGDTLQPHVTTPGFGASERLVISPGHESDGIFEMPLGEAGNPLTPYYLSGTAAWIAGEPTAFLPGPARWTLILLPG